MCDSAFWLPLMQSLSASQDPLPCQVADYGDADDLKAMVEGVLATAPAEFVLAGHSMGGRVALEVARLAPSRIRKLVLMDTGYLPLAPGEAGDIEKAGRMALIRVAQQDGVRAMASQWIKGMVHPARLADTALISEILDMFARKSAERFVRQQNALLTRPDASAVLAGLSLPTLLLCGRQDGWASVPQHQAMQALAPHASLSVVEDAGYMVLMERPEPTIQAIRAFIHSSLERSC